MLAELRDIAGRLQALPRHTLPAGFTNRVVRQLPPPVVTIRPADVRPRPDATRRWLSRTLVTAAGVFLALGVVIAGLQPAAKE